MVRDDSIATYCNTRELFAYFRNVFPTTVALADYSPPIYRIGETAKSLSLGQRFEHDPAMDDFRLVFDLVQIAHCSADEYTKALDTTGSNLPTL